VDGGWWIEELLLIVSYLSSYFVIPARHSPGKHPAGIQKLFKLVPGSRALQGIRREDD